MEIPPYLDVERRQLKKLLEQAQTDPRFYSQCIDLMDSMLKPALPSEYPAYCSSLLQNLGQAYEQLPSEERNVNPLRAIACFERAVAVCSQEQSPQENRRALTHLGFAYTNLATGDRLGNLRRAIGYYQQALSTCNPDLDPLDYGMVLNAMGAAFYALPLGTGAVNLRQAIACYEGALQVCTPDISPSHHVMIRQNLGEAYARLPTGDRTEGLLSAISCYLFCLPLRPREEDPLGWAALQVSLGDAYCQLWAGDRRQHLLHAIRHYEEALSALTGDEATEDRAGVLVNLGNAYYLLPAKDRVEPLQRALACFREALLVFRGNNPWQYAAVQNDLGMVEADWPAGDRGEHLEAAVACYQEALSYYRQDVNPLEYASALGNLGDAYAALWGLGNQDAWERAIACLEHAARVYDPDISPAGYRKVKRRLGVLWMKAMRWDEAHEALSAAIEANEWLYQTSVTDLSRQSEMEEAADLYRNDAYCLARIGSFDQAVLRVEMGRTRALAESMARDSAALGLASVENREAFRASRDRVKALEAETRSLGESTQGFVALSQELRSARRELASLVKRIRQQAPGFMQVGATLSETSRVAPPDRPLVYVVTATAGSVALIVPHGVQHLCQEHVVWLDAFNEQQLEDLLYGPDDAPGLVDGLADNAYLLKNLPRICDLLDEKIMASLAQRLSALGYGRCSLIPCGRLSLLPLHAAHLPDACEPSALEVAYIPSASVLRGGVKDAGDTPRRLLAVVDPPHSVRVKIEGLSLALPMPRLPMASAEVKSIAGLFTDVTVLEGGQATRAAVLPSATDVSHLHFACHAHFAARDPLHSGLALAGEDRLTVRDILDEANLSRARLVTLSACQTSLAEFERIPDELVGLPAAFLQAGAAVVVGSLWEVPDVATALLLQHFYRLHLEDGLSPAAALRQSQRWLRESTATELNLAQWYERLDAESGDAAAQQKAAYYRAHPDEKPFAHPYYWAAFTCTGAGT